MNLSNHIQPASSPLQLWGGLECTVNRVRDNYFSQMDRNGHAERLQDLERFASLGIRAIRYPVLWERTAPDGIDVPTGRGRTSACPCCSSWACTPIVGLVHHGSGPRHTSLVGSTFRKSWRSTPAPWRGAIPGSRTTPRSTNSAPPPASPACTACWYPHGTQRARPSCAPCSTSAAPRCWRCARSAPSIRTPSWCRPTTSSRTYGTPEMADDRRISSTSAAGWAGTCCAAASTNDARAVGLPARVRGARPRNCCGSRRTPARPTSWASTTTSPASAGSTTASTAIPHSHRTQ